MQDMILHYEEISANAFPALQNELLDGWVLRYSEGYTFRGNSVLPLHKGDWTLREKVIQAENRYFQQNLPCVFKMTEAAPDGLDKLLAQRGYDSVKTAYVWHRSLHGYSMPKNMEAVSLDLSMSDTWMDGFLHLNGTDFAPMDRVASKMLRDVRRRVFCAAIYREEKMVACGLGVMENGYVGLYDIRVAEAQRRQHLGTAICSAIMQAAKASGCHSAYLQVAQTNEAAQALYTGLGFTLAYSYWFRLKNLPG